MWRCGTVEARSKGLGRGAAGRHPLPRRCARAGVPAVAAYLAAELEQLPQLRVRECAGGHAADLETVEVRLPAAVLLRLRLLRRRVMLLLLLLLRREEALERLVRQERLLLLLLLLLLLHEHHAVDVQPGRKGRGLRQHAREGRPSRSGQRLWHPLPTLAKSQAVEVALMHCGSRA
jgi:hypothetical protein